ncbi:MAG TPA: hypothetical protein VID03_00870, partial [Acidimicrobiia bacterium]
MTYHPRENWVPGRRGHYMTRREFVRSMAVAGLAFPSLSALLAACGSGSGSGGDAQVVIGTPANPATQPMVDSNPMIADGLPSEEGPLKLYNWDEYINLDMLDRAKQELGADIEVT